MAGSTKVATGFRVFFNTRRMVRALNAALRLPPRGYSLTDRLITPKHQCGSKKLAESQKPSAIVQCWPERWPA
jgi:hypothetical protein